MVIERGKVKESVWSETGNIHAYAGLRPLTSHTKYKQQSSIQGRLLKKPDGFYLNSQYSLISSVRHISPQHSSTISVREPLFLLLNERKSWASFLL